MRSRYVQLLRNVIQWGFLLFCIYLGVRLSLFVDAIRVGSIPTVTRANGVEAFLPIAGLMGLRDWIESGSLNPVHPAATVIFIAAILVSFLLRRGFCSWICPIGTLSEFAWKRGFGLFRRNLKAPLRLDIPLRGIKYLLLFFFVWTIFRMPSQALTAFIHSDYSKIADVRMLNFFLHLSLTALTVILILTLISLPIRNPFCRYLCPYGALTGLAGWFSPVAVTRNTHHCVRCGVCNQVCPSYLPIMENRRMHSPECIGCWRCVSNCRADGALEMALPGGKPVLAGIVYAVLLVGIFWGITLLARVTGHWESGVSIAEYMRLLGG